MTTRTPVGLGAGGKALWRDVTAAHQLGPVEFAQLTEACRIKDRLDKLDELLRGDADAWVRLVDKFGDGENVELKVDGAMSEARQQATVFKQLLAALRLPDAETGKKPQPRGGARGAYKPSGQAGAAGKVSSILDRMQA